MPKVVRLEVRVELTRACPGFQKAQRKGLGYLCFSVPGTYLKRWWRTPGTSSKNWSLGTSRGLLYPSTSSEGPDKFGPGQRDAGGLLRVVQGLPRGQRSPRMRSPGLHYRIAPLPVCDQVPHRGNVFPASAPPKSRARTRQLLNSTRAWRRSG
ncbi:KH homology domain-containing protein 1 isoform X3 [Bubalus bubalis]|uniref:KH homology domain-containing protein 1 isoform X3 n=1 Tax=Bubalus bubalis TaxID=89462 RepID=UPI001D118C2C|nr:KH homology domain-containing protein 1 isoform X3 [Bubalus bubalis]